MEGDGVDWQGLNRANWDDRVPVHLASSFYDLAGFRAGASTLRPFEASEVGSVSGLSLVHLQCHIGLDTLSWARQGALVSGLDFSAPAISAASSLAVELGFPAATFVVADVYDALAAFGGQRFDIVYTGVGALVWLPDIPRWARVVAGLLAPGGFVYLVEGHPFAQILDGSSGLAVARDYFERQPLVEDYPYSYTDGPALAHQRTVEFQHGLGEIVTSLVAAGLRIEFLHEWDFDDFARFDWLVRREDGTFRFPPGEPRVPLVFSLRASAAGRRYATG